MLLKWIHKKRKRTGVRKLAASSASIMAAASDWSITSR
jgi:hypothetical protein